MKKTPVRVHLKKVVDALKTKPMSYSELKQLGIPEKTLSRVLRDYLEPMELVEKTEAGLWVWRQTQVTAKTEADFKALLRHSKKLTITSADFQRFDCMNPELAVSMLAFPEAFTLDGEEAILNSCFKQHLKTGYPNVYKLLVKYRKTRDTEALLKIKGELYQIVWLVKAGKPLLGSCIGCPGVTCWGDAADPVIKDGGAADLSSVPGVGKL
ncbi:MAG: hypothetical protein ACQXXJ_02215 [Candidatus Bathyarchaeia archaeon]|jgi:hypothetical protein